MTREDARPFIGLCVDDALSERKLADMPSTARLVGWQCGFQPLFVAVWSACNQPGDIEPFDADDAVAMATDLLLERHWFADDKATEPDYVI